MKYRSRTKVFECERIDNHGWLVTDENGRLDRVPESIFHQEYELIPNVQRILSRTEPFEEYIALRFDGNTVGHRLASLDMIRRWDPDSNWEPTSPKVLHILSECGTYWIPAGYWLIYRGKEFLFPCTPDYFCERFTLQDEV